MDDRIKGAAKQVTGSIKEAIGMIIGDPAVQAEGAAEKAAGEQQSRKSPDHDAEKPARDGN